VTKCLGALGYSDAALPIAQRAWSRRLETLVALVRNSARFHKGKLFERPRSITLESSTGPAETTGAEVA
jgi:hypothetical protein